MQIATFLLATSTKAVFHNDLRECVLIRNIGVSIFSRWYCLLSHSRSHWLRKWNNKEASILHIVLDYEIKF